MYEPYLKQEVELWVENQIYAQLADGFDKAVDSPLCCFLIHAEKMMTEA